jgi:hypothetical protein
MRIAQIEVLNFRGIRRLDPWCPAPGVNCLIGPGDSTKTTILDALELCLYPRSNFVAEDSDFFNLDTGNPLRITITLTDLPKDFENVDRYGYFLRAWDEAKKKVEDEPRIGLPYALSIAVEADSSLECRWYIYNERIASSSAEQPSVRTKDIDLLAASRLGGYADRHLGWGRNSILSRIADEGGRFTNQLAAARRAAKQAFEQCGQTPFEGTAKRAEALSKSFAVPVQTGFRANLDLNASAISSGGIALHDGRLPLRRLGTGSSRLIVAALQHAVGSPSISIIDEIENGLEPHRIARLLQYLKKPKEVSSVPPQVFMTTHSVTVIRELSVNELFSVRSEHGETRVLSAAEKAPDRESAQKLLRAEPDAFLARRIVVGEGRTEAGLVRGLDTWWTENGLQSFALAGAIAINGEGTSAPQRCVILLDLKHSVFLLRDTDKAIDSQLKRQIENKGGVIEGWKGNCSTEERIFLDVPWKTVGELIAYAEESKGSDSVLAGIQAAATPGNAPLIVSMNFESWSETPQLRQQIGRAAKQGKWYKSIECGQRIGQIIAPRMAEIPDSPLSASLKKLRDWIDA